jgi:hypothetical protein
MFAMPGRGINRSGGGGVYTLAVGLGKVHRDSVVLTRESGFRTGQAAGSPSFGGWSAVQMYGAPKIRQPNAKSAAIRSPGTSPGNHPCARCHPFPKGTSSAPAVIRSPGNQLCARCQPFTRNQPRYPFPKEPAPAQSVTRDYFALRCRPKGLRRGGWSRSRPGR